MLVFGANPRPFPMIVPEMRYELGGVILTNIKLLIFVRRAVLMVVLHFLVQKTWTGKAMRALSVNLDAAKLMGIDVNRMIAFTFVIGSALAAAGGILFGLDQTKIDPLMGVLIGLKAFVAAVLGGIGNIPGAAARRPPDRRRRAAHGRLRVAGLPRRDHVRDPDRRACS